MATKNRIASGSDGGITAIQRITDASIAVESARAGRGVESLAVAQEGLRTVVQAANDEGVSWQCIGDALGLRRGAAYQRFRSRPDTTSATRICDA